jgi:cell wall-associated NlpC family hydrolase
VAWSLLAALMPFVPVRAEPGIAPGTPAVIVAGQPVPVRVSPGWDAAVAYELADGSPVTVWDAEQTAPDGSLWYPIDGGFVSADAVTSATDGAAPAATTDGSTTPDSTPDPSSVEDTVPALDATAGTVPATEAAPEKSFAPVTTEPLGQPIGTATIAGTGGQGAACRAAPDANAPALAVFGDGNRVDLRGGATGEWTPVNCAGVGGYIDTALLAISPSAPPSTQPTSPEDVSKIEQTPAASAPVAAPVGQDTGEQIADFALQYQGYPYVYAGEGPWAFDCSGFTMFVINQTLGLNVPHDMTQQFAMGQPVSRDALQPGDLVFFANTLHPGMSHDGIYIGGGKFVHAENEGDGVKVSELDDDYYSSRWYGAVRFTPGMPSG